jgi:uroporphyrinogen decarboxylase
VGLDWTTDMGDARRRVGDQVALQGNMDPMCPVRDPGKGRGRSAARTRQFRTCRRAEFRGHVFNLGHGISQFTPPETVKVLVDTVHSHSRRGFAPG